MKIVRFDGGRTGLVIGKDGDQIVDVWASRGALPGAGRKRLTANLPKEGRGSWESMIANWDALREDMAALIALAGQGSSAVCAIDLARIALEAPLPSTERRIFSLGANTIEHVRAAAARLNSADVSPERIYGPRQQGASPVGFNVYPDSVVGPGAVITPPPFVQKLDYEGECAVVMGARRPGQPWRDQIWGGCVWSDFGMRDGHLGLIAVTPSFGYSLNLWKNFDGANVCGPWMVVDEGVDWGNLNCRTYVNGELRQDWNTKEMIYSFEDALQNFDIHMPLKPGDMVSSGTGAGTALEFPLDSDLWLKAGDTVEIQVDGLGRLSNTIARWF